MISTYRMNAADLDNTFIDALKTLFRDKEIEIVVSEVDETAYLLHSPANRQRLLQAIENVNSGANLVPVEIDDTI
jgi:antitoxin YefM